MKGTKTKSGTGSKGTKTGAGVSQAGSRTTGTASKNSKEAFIKKLQICMKTYDYKDETKDVRGKTERLNAINELQQMLSD